MTMTKVRSRSIKKAGRGFLMAIVGVAALAGAGIAAYKVFFNRTGEAAIQLLPADADVVVTLDTAPSERQALTFSKINDALKKEGIAQNAENMLKSMMDESPIAAEIRPHLKTSFAMAYWKTDPGKPTKMAALMAIDDAEAVRQSVAKLKKSGEVYSLPNDSGVAAVVDNYLAITSDAKLLEEIEKVRAKSSSSIADSAAFSEARAALPSDANIMVFVSPNALKVLGEEMKRTSGGANPLAVNKWMALSMTVEPEGIAFDYSGPTDAEAMPSIKNLASIAPLNESALRAFPEGALGVVAYSQPGRFWGNVKDMASQQQGGSESFEKSTLELEKQLGFSIEKDLVPALGGEAVLALYGSANGKEIDGDVIAMLSDSNGAAPAELAKKIRTLIERETAKNNERPVTFVESEINGATVWEIDPATRKSVLDNAGKETDPRFSALMTKSLFVVLKGQSVMLTTSKGMVNRLLNPSGKTLMDDPGFAVLTNELEKGPQGLFALNVTRTLQTVRPMLEESMKGDSENLETLMKIFGDGTMPLYAVGKYDGKMGTGRMMIPLDYDVLIHAIGKATKSMSSPQGMPAPTEGNLLSK